MLQSFVAIDLETTGLQPAEDEIIEVAAVKFRGAEVLDTFHTLVDPGRPLPPFIQAFTGITPVDLHGAPRFSAIASALGSFIRGYPIVGQKVAFDLGFLAAKGIAPSAPVYDAYDLATALLPGIGSYRLSEIGKALGIPFSTLHRALADAVLTKDVFLALLDRLMRLDPGVLMQMGQVAGLARLPLHTLLQSVIEERVPALYPSPGEEWMALPPPRPSSPSPLTAKAQRERLDPEAILGLLGPEGPFAAAIPSYEQRPGQLLMLRGVVEAINDGGQLLVEAGTGTGKSLAYLLPASVHAVRNRVPVVISTNTINLQEQLVGKDIPSLLEAIGDSWLAGLRVAQLKGRSNYLCLRRWQRLPEGTDLSPDEARLVLRLLVWLPQTETGDRAELNLTPGEARVWERVSAQADNCLTSQCRFLADGSCYLYSARRRAETSHIVVTNHALLLADAAGPGRVLPDGDYLIVDEAHHLEEEATRHFGYQVTAGDLWRLLDNIAAITGQAASRGVLSEALGSRAMAPELRRDIEKLANTVARRAGDARKGGNSLFGALAALGADHDAGGKYLRQMRITRGTRNQSEWADIELAWENLDLVLSDVESETLRLQSALGDMSPEATGVGNAIAELTSLLYTLAELRRRLTAILLNPEANYVYWLTSGDKSSTVTLCAAPLYVGYALAAAIFSRKETVVLTSATLSTEGSFAYIKESLALRDAAELLIGAPFDYLGSTLLYIPNDIPEPDRPGYAQAVEAALLTVASAARGRTLALFTSHASLQAAYAALKAPLEREGIQLLGQGIDGSPQQLLARFKRAPGSLLLGTSSFWEGVDIVGEALSVLVMVKLPFTVPTDPVFAARSETYDDPFQQLAMPQAILRFRQGFGRLIRSSSDRGAMVVLDRRIIKRGYGSAFLQSLPPCTIKTAPLAGLSTEIEGWLSGARRD